MLPLLANKDEYIFFKLSTAAFILGKFEDDHFGINVRKQLASRAANLTDPSSP